MAEPAELLTPARIADLLAAHGLRPSKALGQHFLADPNTARKIVRLAGVGPGDAVLEIGPGLGSLTLALLAAGTTVDAIEVDPRVAGLLGEVLGVPLGPAGRTPAGSGEPPPVRVHVADALTADLGALAPAARTLVANLPYSIAVPLLLKVFRELAAIRRCTVMVQREVGERLAAAPGSRAYGAPSAKLAGLGVPRIVAPVSRRVFFPEPRVDSVLLAVERRTAPAVSRVGFAAYARVVDAAFGQRRKTLRNALRALGLDAAAVEAGCRAAGVDPRARAEHLGVAQFGALAAALPVAEPAGVEPA